MFYGDYHTHTKFSDGRDTVVENVRAAAERGLAEVALTDHGYRCFAMSMREEKLARLSDEIEAARRAFPNIKIYQGIEANLTDLKGSIDMTLGQCTDYDLILAGYHRWVFPRRVVRDFVPLHLKSYLSEIFRPGKETVARNTKAVIAAVSKYPIAILTHLNDHMIVNVKEIAKCCADYGTYLELNVKHLDVAADSIEAALSTDAMLIANTDAHRSAAVGNFNKMEILIKEFSVPEKKIANLDKMPEFRRTKKKS